eukprot:CAMPEP_0197032884 /NCGR_PEP_ID=MMETSP1384-20130603/11434_1 /TAXON_ID=29189 /ORGANISM="Ammonia sp." /LENGTH=96 /DNA_ID=CAMNT_0042462601 /DNA_START=37 /DNA_END=327 /DNA_ORIENTATION=+
MNSLCVLLLLEYASSIYRKACVCLDKAMQRVFQHVNPGESNLADVMQISNVSRKPKLVIHAYEKETAQNALALQISDSNLSPPRRTVEKDTEEEVP